MTVILVILGVLGTLALALATSLITGEVTAWLPRWADLLVERTAKRLPASSGDRYAAEWRGELGALPGPVSKLRAALSIALRCRKLRKFVTEPAPEGKIRPITVRLLVSNQPDVEAKLRVLFPEGIFSVSHRNHHHVKVEIKVNSHEHVEALRVLHDHAGASQFDVPGEGLTFYTLSTAWAVWRRRG